MEITNLMLNDYVIIHCSDGSDIVIKVTRIEGEGGTVYGVFKKGSHWANIEDVKPIPLTPEILEKNGFESIITVFNGLTYQYANIDEEYRVRVFVNDKNIATGIEIDSKVCWLNNDCSFVHELQHVLKVCRVEKEIEL